MECIIKVSIEKVPLIPPTHVFQPTFEGDEDGGISTVKSQQHSNVIYKVYSLFIKHAICTCEWAICEFFCKHQVLLTSIDLTKNNIMKYCGTWFGSDYKGF
jgi:hypothetical protein